jgi:hypothetical protein
MSFLLTEVYHVDGKRFTNYKAAVHAIAGRKHMIFLGACQTFNQVGVCGCGCGCVGRGRGALFVVFVCVFWRGQGCLFARGRRPVFFFVLLCVGRRHTDLH